MECMALARSLKTALFDRPYKWKWDAGSKDIIRLSKYNYEGEEYLDLDDIDLIAEFRAEVGRIFTIQHQLSQDAFGSVLSEVIFFDNDRSAKLTGRGDAFKIMATVLDNIRWCMDNMDYVEEFFFTAAKPYMAEDSEKQNESRSKLYEKMIDRYIGKYRGWRVKPIKKVMFNEYRIIRK